MLFKRCLPWLAALRIRPEPPSSISELGISFDSLSADQSLSVLVAKTEELQTDPERYSTFLTQLCQINENAFSHLLRRKISIPLLFLQTIVRSRKLSQFQRVFDSLNHVDQRRLAFVAMGQRYFAPFSLPQVQFLLQEAERTVLRSFRRSKLPDFDQNFNLTAIAIEMLVMAGNVHTALIYLDRLGISPSSFRFVSFAAEFLTDDVMDWIVEVSGGVVTMQLVLSCIGLFSSHTAQRLIRKLKVREFDANRLAQVAYEDSRLDIFFALFTHPLFDPFTYRYESFSAGPLTDPSKLYIDHKVRKLSSSWDIDRCLLMCRLLHGEDLQNALAAVMSRILELPHSFDDLIKTSRFGLQLLFDQLNPSEIPNSQVASTLLYLRIVELVQNETRYMMHQSHRRWMVSSFRTISFDRDPIVLEFLLHGTNLLNSYLIACVFCDIIVMHEIQSMYQFPHANLRDFPAQYWHLVPTILHNDIVNMTTIRMDLLGSDVINVNMLIDTIKKFEHIDVLVVRLLKGYATILNSEPLLYLLRYYELPSIRDEIYE